MINRLLSEILRNNHRLVRLVAYIVYLLLVPVGLLVLILLGANTVKLLIPLAIHSLLGIAFTAFDNWIESYYVDTRNSEPPMVVYLLVMVVIIILGPSPSFWIYNVKKPD